jgi:hypothetical protein
MTPRRPLEVLPQEVLHASYLLSGSHIWLPAAQLSTFLEPSGLGLNLPSLQPPTYVSTAQLPTTTTNCSVYIPENTSKMPPAMCLRPAWPQYPFMYITELYRCDINRAGELSGKIYLLTYLLTQHNFQNAPPIDYRLLYILYTSL